MARWNVNRNDSQFAVNGLAELRDLARSGRLSGGDMVQPPNATGWLYASDIPELQEALTAGRSSASAVDELDAPGQGGGGGAFNVIIGALLLAFVVGGGWYLYQSLSSIPEPVKGDAVVGLGGLRGVSKTELVVTKPAKLLADPQESASAVSEVAKDEVLTLLAKRGEFYKAKSKKGSNEGWIQANKVLPLYMLGGGDVRKELDPLYNPEDYVEVANASWTQPDKKKKATAFSFLLKNTSAFDMADLVLVAAIKDSKGHDLEKVEFKLEGVVPAGGQTWVGTVVDPKTKETRLATRHSFDIYLQQNPDVKLEYTEGVEVPMQNEDFTEARIDIAELRAVDKKKAE